MQLSLRIPCEYAILMVVPALLLAGCGGGGGDSPSPSPSPAGPTTTLTTTAFNPFPDFPLCKDAYKNVLPCPAGTNPGTKQDDWTAVSSMECAGPCDGYATFQWTAAADDVKKAIQSRNGGKLISPKNEIPTTLEDLGCWFLPQFSWGMQHVPDPASPGAPLGDAPPWNPQPEAAYIDDAGDALGGGLPGPDATVPCCCQEECTTEMTELRHWVYVPPGCKNASIDYNQPASDNGRVLLTKASNRNGGLKNLKHEECMCGKKTRDEQLPFYYYVVQGPANHEGPTSVGRLQKWIDSLRTAYSNLYDIWASQPPCSGECLIMGGASDSWVTYGQSTSRSVMVQLRAFAAFDPKALPNACGTKGVMLRFAGMTLDNGKVLCNAAGNWGQTGAQCPTEDELGSDFSKIVLESEQDIDFFKLLPNGPTGLFHDGFKMTLETERAKATISLEDGVKMTNKRPSSGACPQPTLNWDWRCKATGGFDKAACVKAPPSSVESDPELTV